MTADRPAQDLIDRRIVECPHCHEQLSVAAPPVRRAEDGLGWGPILVGHLEAIHGCEHTAQARDELGMLPREVVP